MFGVESVKKGYFPYKFYTSENRKYIGPLPALEFFNESDKKSPEFKKFYDDLKDKTYNIDQEVKEYCINDVYITRKCFEIFRSTVYSFFSIDPLMDSLTIASLSFLVFKQKFLFDDIKIPVIDRIPRKKQWREPMTWLNCIEEESNIVLETARSFYGERPIRLRGGQKVYPDGYHQESKTAYSYHGCYNHGCRECGYAGDFIIRKSCGEDVLAATLARDKLIEEDFEHVVCWAHEINQKKARCEVFRERWNRLYLKNSDLCLTPLNPGDALFGGRTNAFRLLVEETEITPPKSIKYVDFCSLYPYVMKTKPFPTDCPEILTLDKIPAIDDFIENINDKYFGLIKLEILPPRKLLLPVLPQVIDSKLMFTLCKTCAIESLDRCNHPPNKRSLIGTWTSIELALALEKGYRIIFIYEIWVFNKTMNLFSGYVNHFLKTKTEASGYPQNITNDTEEKIYVEEYYHKEGIALDPELIEKNPGKRTLAKLQLNNLWGKFAQNSDRLNTVICSNYQEYFETMQSACKEIRSIHTTKNKAVIRYKIDHNLLKPDRNTNVVIAAFTTAYGRVELYHAMDKVKNQLLYVDTDSLMYVSNGENDLPTGVFLGNLTDEITDAFGVGAYGISFVSSGPKTYCLEIKTASGDKKFITRCKGFSLKDGNENIIHRDSLRALVMGHETHITARYQQFKAGPYGGVDLIEGGKNLKNTYRKRKMIQDYKTLPWGYC